MNQGDFNHLLKRRYEQMVSVLSSKGEEYASEEDVTESFKSQAELSIHNTPAGIGWELLVKHLYSVRRIIKEHEKDGTVPSREFIDEKFGDAINYLVLIESLLVEEMPPVAAAEEEERMTAKEMLSLIDELIDDMVEEMPAPVKEEGGEYIVSSEWLVGRIYAREFISKGLLEAVAIMIDYLYRQKREGTPAGEAIRATGFPDVDRMYEYCMNKTSDNEEK